MDSSFKSPDLKMAHLSYQSKRPAQKGGQHRLKIFLKQRLSE